MTGIHTKNIEDQMAVVDVLGIDFRPANFALTIAAQ